MSKEECELPIPPKKSLLEVLTHSPYREIHLDVERNEDQVDKTKFEWDPRKNEANVTKHDISFFDAQQAFLDPHRIIAQDLEHSTKEIRYYCFGRVDGMVVTVRFTYRHQTIRIFGAGYWRQGRKIYEKAQK